MRAFTLTMFVILIVLSGTVTVYGYNQFVEAAAINNLEVSLYDIKLVAFGLRSCDLLLELKIHNPNRVAASIGKTAYHIYYNGTKLYFLGNGTIPATRVDPNTTLTIKSPFYLDNKGFVAMLGEVFVRGIRGEYLGNLVINGTSHTTVFIFPIKVAFKWVGELGKEVLGLFDKEFAFRTEFSWEFGEGSKMEENEHLEDEILRIQEDFIRKIMNETSIIMEKSREEIEANVTNIYQEIENLRQQTREEMQKIEENLTRIIDEIKRLVGSTP